MNDKNSYLKILFEITNKASNTYRKYQDFRHDPSSFQKNEPSLYVTFQMIDKVINSAKEKIENTSSNYSDNSTKQKSFTLREEYYSILECKINDSNEVIKINYRRLVKDYHPDTIAGKDLPKPFIEFANKRFNEIHTAYEYIKKERDF